MPDPGRSNDIPKERRLDSWKEIAAYLRRDVKTARRWEQREGLPVHRHHHGVLGSVYAYVDEIETWRSHRRSAAPPIQRTRRRMPPIVGRTREMSELQSILARAARGERQSIFITGATGIGKTALAHAFLASLDGRASIAEGECVEPFAHSEPYLPFTDALVQLAASEDRRRVIDALGRCAPLWTDLVLQRPPSTPPNATSHNGDGARWSRELCRLIEALAARKPLIIVINNMHLIDPASLEVLSRLARRHETAQLMMIGTYRTEVVRKAQPGLSHLTRELRAHFQCTELPLDVLDVAAVTDYLEWLGPWRNLVEAASWFHHRSGGNPLFLAHLVQHLTDIGAVVMSNGYRMLDDAVSEREDTIPSTLRGLIEAWLSSLDRTPQTVLETASVVGDSFSAVDIANAADIPVPDVERVLRHAAYGEFIQCDGSRQARDGTVASRYRFRHEICRAVVQDQVPVSIQTALKQRVEIRGGP